MTAFITKLLLAIALFFFARFVSSKIKERETKNERRTRNEGDADEIVVRRRQSSSDSVWDSVNVDLLRLVRKLARAAAAFVVLWAIVGTSFVWVKSGHIATLTRTYFGKSLEPGQIVALEGQLGPQAKVLTAGFHVDPFISLLNDIEQVPVFTVPPGKCAIMSAKDGLPISNASAFAEPWPDAIKHKMANDAAFFLTRGKDGGNGQRGPQATVIGPGSYTINPFL